MLIQVVVVAAILVLVVLAVERWVRDRAPREASRRLSAALGVPTHVNAVGRPRDWILRRTVPAVALAADGVPIRGGRAQIDHLAVTLLGVRLEGRGSDRRVVADEGNFVATLSQEQLRRLIDLPPLVRGIELRGERVRLLTSGGLAIDVRLRANDGAIELRPVGNPLGGVLPVRYRIPLDNLPAGAQVVRAVVRNGAVVASGPLDGARLSGPRSA